LKESKAANTDALSDAEYVDLIWKGIIRPLDMSSRPDQIGALAVKEVAVRGMPTLYASSKSEPALSRLETCLHTGALLHFCQFTTWTNVSRQTARLFVVCLPHEFGCPSLQKLDSNMVLRGMRHSPSSLQPTSTAYRSVICSAEYKAPPYICELPQGTAAFTTSGERHEPALTRPFTSRSSTMKTSCRRKRLFIGTQKASNLKAANNS
jgi:hypothetical protein